MIGFADFRPKVLNPQAFIGRQFEPLQSAVDAANEWIRHHNIQVLNVETVLLPNVDGQDTTGGAIGVYGDRYTEWSQVFRVWYRYGG